MTPEEADALLPQQPTKAITNPVRLKYLMIGPPKWGKTTFMCSAPDSILLAFEEGHAFHETYKIIIDCWDRSWSDKKDGWGTDEDGNAHTSFVEAVEAITRGTRFQFVVVDTADMAAKMCLDYHYKKYGVSYASDAGDYGKGWDLCLTQPFRQQIGALMKSGRGIGFVTHTNIVEKKVGSSTVTRAETTLPSQVQKFLHTQADLILHGFFGKKRKGLAERDRVISLDGTNEILAGSRIRHIHMPKKFIVDPIHPWEQWADFFEKPEAANEADEQYRKLVLGGKEEDQVAAEPEVATISEPAEPQEPKREATPARRQRKAA
jgi:AAA domain